MTRMLDRRQFLTLALIVEGGLIVLAVLLAWALNVPLAELLEWNPEAIAWGIGTTIPLCLVFGAAYWKPMGSYRRIKDFLLDSLGPSLAACRWYELLVVAALAGIGEELLFRGVLQTWMVRWGYPQNLILSNIVFALCHAITVTYTILAFAMGILLGLLLDAPAQRSLLAPILTHALYDFFAFCLLAMDWRRRQRQLDEESFSNPAEESEIPAEP